MILSPCIRTNDKITNFILWLPYIIINIINLVNIGPFMTGNLLNVPIAISLIFLLLFYLLLMTLIPLFMLFNIFMIAGFLDTIIGILTFGKLYKVEIIYFDNLQKFIKCF